MKINSVILCLFVGLCSNAFSMNGDRQDVNNSPTFIAYVDGHYDGMFANARDVIIPYSVSSIIHDSFLGCSGLTSVHIPNSVSGIGNGAFYGCDNAKFKVASEAMKKYLCKVNEIDEDRVEVDSSLFSADHAWKWAEDGHIYIPANVTEILPEMFFERSDIKSIIIPRSVTSIDSSAFFYCTGLTSITIPNSVTYVGESAFEGCDGLREINVFSEETKQLILDSKSDIYPNMINVINN